MGQGLIDLGNGVIGFIDGPNGCKHVWKGDVIYYTQSGKRITPYTHMKWVSYTSEFREILIYEHYEMIGDPIVEMCSTCKKCKKEFNPFWDINEN